MRMLDLFAGMGGASRAMRVRGWDVVTVDNAPELAPDIRADIRDWQPSSNLVGVDLVWASPPCTEFSLARVGPRPAPNMGCLDAALHIIGELRPRWWVIENVRGACRIFRPRLGPYVQSHGPVFLWGVFPWFEARVPPYKTKTSGDNKARRRAVTPYVISEALALACERIGPAAARAGVELARPAAPWRGSSPHVARGHDQVAP